MTLPVGRGRLILEAGRRGTVTLLVGRGRVVVGVARPGRGKLLVGSHEHHR